MLHVAFVRSDYAHGRLIEVDVSAARERPGVAAVYTVDGSRRLRPAGAAARAAAADPRISSFIRARTCRSPADKVRYVGEPIAMIVAESRYIAEDAVRDVVVDVEPLDAVVDLEAALDGRCAARARGSRLERRGARGAAQG